MAGTNPRQPITKQRSQWTQQRSRSLMGWEVDVYTRRVGDGLLTALVGEEPNGMHLSVSHRGHKNNHRYPSWDELADARDKFLPHDRAFGMIFPAWNDYVAIHDTTFHIHELPEWSANVQETAPG